ncbi:putative multiple-sugar transport system permease YteP [compost metagenome]
MYGVLIAFKDYSVGKGIWASPWNNFAHFRALWDDFIFLRALRNTLIINGLKLVFGFLAPLLFALLLNEIGKQRFKKLVQSVSYLPHFMSWVIVSGMITEVLSPQRGIINYIVTLFGGDPTNFLADPRYFVSILIISDIWKEIGWGAILYLASIASISPELYEAAEVDGANRYHRMRFITLPSLVPVITILFILRISNILDMGFDQVLNMYNPVVYEVSDILDTYVYRTGLVDFKMDYSAAVGLFKNAIGVALLLGTNAIIRKYNEHGVW